MIAPLDVVRGWNVLMPAAAGQPSFKHTGKIRCAIVALVLASYARCLARAQTLLGRSGLGRVVAAREGTLDRAVEPGDGIADILGCGVRKLAGLSQHGFTNATAEQI
jgi:hypothetical protein